jgi:excinuclease ABC subunit C
LVSISDNYKRLTSVARSESIDREDITARHQLITDQLTQGILGVAGSSSLPKKHYQAVAPVIEKALDSYIVSTSWKDESMMKELLNTLQDRYYFKAFPYHIECVDISHMSGKHTSGGLSALVGGVPSQHYYRNYRIQSVSGGDDYGALREVLIRRFKLDSTDTPHQLPDVFILDGGLRQLGIVRVLMQEYPVFSEVMQTTQFAALEK